MATSPHTPIPRITKWLQAKSGCELSEILGVNVTASSYQEVAERSLKWAKAGDSKALCFATVHMLMEAF
jgi:UDP-N-acetyl-D-mannosaminuronic acid transferase (WecB/TagA/CpsF family)